MNNEGIIMAVKNKHFKEVDCKNGGCPFFFMTGGKSFCKANRKQRRKMKCFVKVK